VAAATKFRVKEPRLATDALWSQSALPFMTLSFPLFNAPGAE
jgi:hypothetical protein